MNSKSNEKGGRSVRSSPFCCAVLDILTQNQYNNNSELYPETEGEYKNGQRKKGRTDHESGRRFCPMVYRYLPQGGACRVCQRQGLYHSASLWLRHLGEYAAIDGRRVQKDRTRERGDARPHPRESTEEGGRARQRLRPRGGVGHDGRQREARRAPCLPSHVRDDVLRPLVPRIADLPPAADALQPVVLRHPLGEDHPSVPALARILVAGGAHHPRDRRGGTGRDDAAA